MKPINFKKALKQALLLNPFDNKEALKNTPKGRPVMELGYFSDNSGQARHKWLDVLHYCLPAHIQFFLATLVLVSDQEGLCFNARQHWRKALHYP